MAISSASPPSRANILHDPAVSKRWSYICLLQTADRTLQASDTLDAAAQMDAVVYYLWAIKYRCAQTDIFPYKSATQLPTAECHLRPSVLWPSVKQILEDDEPVLNLSPDVMKEIMREKENEKKKQRFLALSTL